MVERQRVDRDLNLFRRGKRSPKYYTYDDGAPTLFTFVIQARDKDTEELSCDVCVLTTPEKAIFLIERFVLFELRNADVLDLDLESFHDKIEATDTKEANPAHAVIVGLKFCEDADPSNECYLKSAALARSSWRVWVDGERELQK